MCSIIGSYDVEEVKVLAKLNSYRGQHSHSIAVIKDTVLSFLRRGLGPLPLEDLDNLPKGYIICHQQAPTTDAKDSSSIHPAEYQQCLLWHNGIVKDKQIKQWQKDYDDLLSWDTMWINQFIASKGFSGLSEIDGTFACAYYNGEHTYIFRNANSPLFRKGSTISSTKFDGSVLIDSGKIFQLENASWEETPYIFKTKEQFFWTPS